MVEAAFGESEGKEGKGIFPAGVNFTADLHSMGQFIQEGTRNLFETVLSVETPGKDADGPDRSGKCRRSEFPCREAVFGGEQHGGAWHTIAHVEGGVPNIRITIPVLNEL